jgi:hypothetical protein
VPNTLLDVRSGGTPWIYSSGAIFGVEALPNTRCYAGIFCLDLSDVLLDLSLLKLAKAILVCHHCNLDVLVTTLNNLDTAKRQSVPQKTFHQEKKCAQESYLSKAIVLKIDRHPFLAIKVASLPRLQAAILNLHI